MTDEASSGGAQAQLGQPARARLGQPRGQSLRQRHGAQRGQDGVLALGAHRGCQRPRQPGLHGRGLVKQPRGVVALGLAQLVPQLDDHQPAFGSAPQVGEPALGPGPSGVLHRRQALHAGQRLHVGGLQQRRRPVAFVGGDMAAAVQREEIKLVQAQQHAVVSVHPRREVGQQQRLAWPGPGDPALPRGQIHGGHAGGPAVGAAEREQHALVSARQPRAVGWVVLDRAARGGRQRLLAGSGGGRGASQQAVHRQGAPAAGHVV